MDDDWRKAGGLDQANLAKSSKCAGHLALDRPNAHDHILPGKLEFDDGAQIDVAALPTTQNNLEIVFPEKPIRWVKFTVANVSADTENTGLSEIAVLQTP